MHKQSGLAATNSNGINKPLFGVVTRVLYLPPASVVTTLKAGFFVIYTKGNEVMRAKRKSKTTGGPQHYKYRIVATPQKRHGIIMGDASFSPLTFNQWRIAKAEQRAAQKRRMGKS